MSLFTGSDKVTDFFLSLIVPLFFVFLLELICITFIGGSVFACGSGGESFSECPQAWIGIVISSLLPLSWVMWLRYKQIKEIHQIITTAFLYTPLLFILYLLNS